MPADPPYDLVWTDTFSRTARKFLRKHPDYVAPFRRLLEQLQHDPTLPRLKMHPLTGRLKGKHSVSLSYAYRVILILRITEKEIILLDVGSHDDVY